jgi:DNA processing protein
MEKSNLDYQLALWLTQGLGPTLQKTIIEQYPNLQEFFELSSTALKTIGFKPELIEALLSPKWDEVNRTLEWAQQSRQHLLLYNSKDYPAQLREISSAPTVLLAKGNKNLLKYSQLAIIGSRNPTRSGLEIAYSYAHYLAQQGLIITSGMALGIDGAAHEGAKSQTIAVLGTGIDVLYPKRHAKLAAEIIESGLLLSEFPLGMSAKAQNFPRRNRIISGLSLGVFVVEAALKSGSLITARLALEQGREIFTIPGSIHNPMAKGCHWLLKQGANLVESVADIWQQLQAESLILYQNRTKPITALDIREHRPHVFKSTIKLTTVQQRLLDAMGFDRISADTLRQRTALSTERLSIELLELEIVGQIETVPGGVQRIQNPRQT